MKPRIKLSLFTAVTILAASLIGCSSSTGTVSTDPTGYVRFLDAKDGDTASIDGKTPVAVDSDKPIMVVPGKHHLLVTRGGSPVLEKDVLISDLQTLELRVP